MYRRMMVQNRILKRIGSLKKVQELQLVTKLLIIEAVRSMVRYGMMMDKVHLVVYPVKI